MTRENSNKTVEPEDNAIAEAYRDAVARGDLEEIERLDAITTRAGRGKPSERHD